MNRSASSDTILVSWSLSNFFILPRVSTDSEVKAFYLTLSTFYMISINLRIPIILTDD